VIDELKGELKGYAECMYVYVCVYVCAHPQVIDELKGELKGYAEMTDALMPTEEELAECGEPFEALILNRRELGQEAVRQCSETLALQLQYLRTPGAALGVLVLRVAEICEQQTAEVRTRPHTLAA
jgi:hypothetical protein